MTLSSGLLQCYSMEPAKVALKKHKNFDALSSHHPVMKVYNGPPKVKISNVHKREKFNDNVRGELELMPKSREDIQGIKQLSYHGKMSPTAEALIGENLSYETTRATTTTRLTTTPKTTKITTTTSRPRRRRYKLKKEAPANRVDIYLPKPTKKFKPSPKLPNTNEKFQKITPSKTFDKKEKPSYVPDDTPFYPLMKPSPINVLPTDPPSFDAVRNYVRYLKMRNEKNYANMHSDEALPLSKVAVAEKKSIIPFDGEIDYFKEREKQLVEDQKREHNRFSPTSSSSSSDESSAANDNDRNNNNNDPYKVQEDDYDDDDGGAGNRSNGDESEANNSEDYSDANYEESENKEKNFVPFKLYAQVILIIFIFQT